MKAILTYHSIDDSGSPISLPPRAFSEHVRWLVSGRVRALPLDQIAAHPDDGPDAVAVTFDDGFVSAAAAVEEVLSNGLPATVFVVSGHVGGANTWGGGRHSNVPTLPLLDWDDLQRLVTLGASIEAHTRSHPDLRRLSTNALDEELLGCQDDLRDRLGVHSAHVAYPFGDVDEAAAIRAARYDRWGSTADFRWMSRGDDPLHLPRLDMRYFRDPGALESWGTPRFARHVAWCRARRALRSRLVSFWA